MNKRISVHHVGGRAGNCSFPFYPQFEPDMVLSLYEADTDCLEQIKERNQYLKAEVNVLPFCLGAKSGEATLFINYDPYTSSLLPANPDFRDYRGFSNYGVFGRQFDYVLGEVLRPMEKRILPLVSIDELFHNGKLGLPPDFLSVDTQGSEYNILTGASDVLDQATLGVALEVEFHPMYAGQKLFGDIYNLLTSKGFLFIGFMEENAEYMPVRTPISLRGPGIQLHNDALFLRTVESVGAVPDERTRCLMLHKLAFLAISFHQVELAYEYLRTAEALGAMREVREELASTVYGRFLAEFHDEARRLPPFFPGTFESEFPSFDASRSRFAVAGKRGTRWLELIRDWFVRKPERWRTMKKILQPISSNGRRAAILFRWTLSGKPFWRHPALQWRSGVERVLKRYGLEDQQKALKRKRWQYAPFCNESVTDWPTPKRTDIS